MAEVNMKESPFVKIFESVASEISGHNLIVEKGANLLYQLQLDKQLQVALSDEDILHPKRGNSAFQTDICIFEQINDVKLPRVVIEFKTGISTHDVLTYSAKAGNHKRIYPYLRYGLLISELDAIPKRVFIHNESLDFVIAAEKYKGENTLRSFTKELLDKEIGISRTLDKIHFENKRYDYYRTDIVFQNFGDK
jgi:hypothetical protein